MEIVEARSLRGERSARARDAGGYAPRRRRISRGRPRDGRSRDLKCTSGIALPECNPCTDRHRRHPGKGFSIKRPTDIYAVTWPGQSPETLFLAYREKSLSRCRMPSPLLDTRRFAPAVSPRRGVGNRSPRMPAVTFRTFRDTDSLALKYLALEVLAVIGRMVTASPDRQAGNPSA